MVIMPIRFIVPAAALAMLVLGGCAKGIDTAAQPAPEAAAPRDGIVLIFLREFSFAARVDDIRDESQIIGCMQNAIRETRPDQLVVSFDELRQVAFPHLASESAPRQPQYLSILLDRPEIRNRVRGIGIRHLAFVGGVTETQRPQGGIICDGAHGVGWCFGMITWAKDSRLAAKILDLEGNGDTRALEATGQGTAWLSSTSSGICQAGRARWKAMGHDHHHR